ncbi:peptide chain release factor 1 [Candidatus Wolfebacteria bacterium]|nr:MAG: peptide chain release factor 1 [Candidatus Wolfebacteria bacterium]
MDLEQYKQDHRTQFLATEYERLESKEAELSGADMDDELAEMIAEEKKEIADQKKGLIKQMEHILNPDGGSDDFPAEIVLEVRAGAGGDEASIFARNLANMYERYSEARGWQFRPLHTAVTDSDGYKEASFEIKGTDVYKDLRFETGVHRVQRVPATEKSGRIHTSTASIAILPIRKKSKLEIDPTEFEMEFSRSGGKGGQNVNKVETAVRIIHKPTGLDVRCTSERSQLKNREKAMAMLMSKLEVLKEEEEAKKHSANRKGQIGTGDRSEKIRTYNILQDRVTDHRIKKSWHGIERIFEGAIEPIIKTLKEYSEEGENGGDSAEA